MATTLSEKPAKPVRKPRLPALSFRLPAFPGTKDIDYHPYFKGAISRWAWRFYTHLLTRSGRGFLLVTLFFLAYGSNSLELQAYVPCLYLLGLWVVAILASGIWRPRVALQARHAERVCAGETVPVEVEVEQKRRLVGTDLSVLPSGLPPTIDAMPEDGVGLPSLARGKKARVTLGLHCKRRGVYTLPGFRVETDFPFGD